MLRVCAALLALASLAGAYSFSPSPPEGEEGISAHDGRGTFYTVYNLFDGRNSSIQVNKLNAQGLVWTVEHADNVRERAAAAAVDADGNLFVAGERVVNRQKTMLTLKFNANGGLEREVADNANDCGAGSVVVDRDGWVTAAGQCRYANSRPVRLVKYDNNLGYYWYAEYDRAARNYLRGLQADVRGRVSATIESVFGDYRDGSYRTTVAVYSPEGRLEEER